MFRAARHRARAARRGTRRLAGHARFTSPGSRPRFASCSRDKPRTAFFTICRSSPDPRTCRATTRPRTPSDIGSTVGPYRLTGRLGRGGMSSVWIAERIDGLLKRRVALKLPHVSWAMPEAARRMARERDLLASLEHPNIARLYDAGMGSDGRPYLALELVDGRADRRILRRPQRRQRHARAPGVADRLGRRVRPFALDRSPRPETFQHSRRRRGTGAPARLWHRQTTGVRRAGARQ